MNVEEIRKRIGVESEPMVCEIEKGMIKRFIQATGDRNPLWWDEEYAKKTESGGIVVPPTFLLIMGFEQFQEQLSPLIPLFSIGLNGGTELVWYQPVRPSDILVLTTKMIEVTEQQTKRGITTFITFETDYRKQGEGLVAKCRQIFIGY